VIQIVLASHNPKKKRELQEILQPFGDRIEVLTLDEVSNLPEVEEDGKTFLENAKKKAATIAHATKRWALGDDSGLAVDALDGQPGVHSARYAGEPRDQARNNAKLLAELQGIPREKRTAHFHCSLALADPVGKICLTAEGRCDGLILDAPRGEGGFGYDPLFYYPPLNKAFAELTPTQKHEVSHRGQAMRQFLEKLGPLLKSCS